MYSTKGPSLRYWLKNVPTVAGTRANIVTDQAMARGTVMQESKLKDFCNKVWMKLGVPEKDAKITTDVLVLADIRGIESHGVARLPRYYADLSRPARQVGGL